MGMVECKIVAFYKFCFEIRVILPHQVSFDIAKYITILNIIAGK